MGSMTMTPSISVGISYETRYFIIIAAIMSHNR